MGDLTVSEVTVATRCPPEAVVQHWPLLLAALKAKSSASRNSQIGLAATVAIETGKFKPVVESLNHSAASLRSVWPKRFPTTSVAMAYARQPEKIANYVYANRNGNGDEESGDGWRYRGRGEIQTTGRRNYAETGAALGVDLLAAPDRLLEAELSAAAAVWYWVQHGCPQACELVNWPLVRQLVNGPAKHNLEGFLAVIRRFGLAV